MKFSEKFDHFLFDLDGVVYVGQNTTKGAPEVLEYLRGLGKKITFVTNNPTRSPRDYSKKLNGMGIKSAAGEIVTSPMAIVYYLTKKYTKLEGKKAYVIGSNYLKSQVRSTGLKVISSVKSGNADFVILGGHSKFNYEEINSAGIFIRKGAKFIATNRDAYYPSESGFSPATGALLASVETATDTKAVTVGKPEKYIFELATIGKRKQECLLIGDNLYTDITGGKKAGISTALSLTGATSRKDLDKSEVRPDYVIEDLTRLIEK